jgi:hypothetical protein
MNAVPDKVLPQIYDIFPGFQLVDDGTQRFIDTPVKLSFLHLYGIADPEILNGHDPGKRDADESDNNV